MNCNCEKEYIYIFKGDDTNWNNEQFLTVNITSQSVDLSSMTAKFILGNFTQTYSLADSTFKVDLNHAVTSVYSYGPIDGIIQILDSEGRIKTVTNTIPFYVTNKVIDEQDAVYNAEVSPNSPLDIEITLGYGIVAWGTITGNINDQLDLKAALYSKVSKVGDTMTGDLVMDNVAVDFGDFKVSTDDGLAKIEGTQYGLRVDTTSGLGAALLTTRGLGEVLTTLDVKDTYSGNSSDPISGKGVAQAISTKQDTLTTAQLTAVNSGIDSAKVAQIATNTQAISNEVLARQGADNNLQTQIDALSAASDVKDIVGTYAELQAYDTSHLGNNDIIKVLTDETHDGAPSYYRWNKTSETFTYIGSESASYTKGEADAKFETITGAAQTYATKSELTTGLATKASNADGTTIVDNGSTISTVAVKEQNNALAIKEWVGTKAQYDAIVTKDANTLYTVTDDPDTQAIIVDSALSSTSTNPVQNKVINTALATKQDALPSGTTGYFLQKTANGVTWAQVQASGAPTLNWYTGNSGNTVTIADTTGASLVKVYKNGLLLRPGQATTTYNFTGASGAYIGLTQTAPLNTANSWAYKARFLTSSNRDNYGVFFGMAGSSDWQAPLICYDANYNRLYVALSSNGTSWNLFQNYTNIYLHNDKTYDIEYGFTGSQYYVKTKLITDLDYTTGWTYSSSTKTVSNQPLQLLNNFDGTGNYNGATLYMKYTKIIIDGVTWFDGNSAVLGTDYTNNGCTAETVSTTTNDYAVSGTTLTLSEDLVGTDTIAVEIY